MEKRGPIEAGRVPFAGIHDKWKAWMGELVWRWMRVAGSIADQFLHPSAGLARELLDRHLVSWVFPFWGSLTC